MATNKRKQDEKHLKLLREMVSLPSNKTCFDCHQRGPTYVNMTIGSFICTSCSGIMRGLNPPHRVKSISMASFTPDEMEFLKSHGNELNRKVYLGLYDSRVWPEPDSRDEQKVRDYMVQKYENKRWYVAPTDAMKEDAKRANEAALNSKPQTKPLRSLLGDSTPKLAVGGSHPAASQSQPGPVRAPPTASSQPSQLPAPAAAKPSSGFDLLSDLGNSDPFASANTAPAPIDNGFADFSNFGNFNNTPSQPISQPQPPQPQQQQQQHHQQQQQPPVQSAVPAATTPFMSNTPLVPLGTNAPAPVSSPASQTSGNSTSTFSAISDRYSALADLDSAFSAPATTATSINWGGMDSGGPINWGGSTSATVQSSQPSSVQWAGVGGGGSAGINWNNPAPAASAPAEPPAQPAGFGVASTGHPGNPFLTQMAANPFGSTPAMPAFSTPGTTPNPFRGNVAPSMSIPFSQPASSAAPGFGAQFPVQTQQAGFGQFPVQNGGFGVAGAYGQSGAGFVQQQPQQQFMMPPQQQQQQQQPGGWGQMGASQAGQPVVNPFMNTAMQAPQVPPPSGATNPFL